MAYDRINWENTPSTNTPLNADNLNNMDAALANLDNLIAAANESIMQLQNMLDLINARIDTIVTRPEGATGLYNILDGLATGSVRTVGADDSGDYTLGNYAFAEGHNTSAHGLAAHVEGDANEASGDYSHAEARNTVASNHHAHAEGRDTVASGGGAHVEGYYTTASGTGSHAEGMRTIANHKCQHVFGECNESDPSSAQETDRGTYVEIVGNGTSNNDRSNARTLDWQGNEAIAGSLTVGKGSASEATLTPTMVDSLRAFHIVETTLAINGTYTLKATVTDGMVTYEWVSG